MWTGWLAARVKPAVLGKPNRVYYTVILQCMYTIYKGVSGLHNNNWRAAGWTPLY